MRGPQSDGTKPQTPAALDGTEAARLAALDARIAQAKGALAPKPRIDSHYSQANLAWRMVAELVAGLMIGFGIGYGLDTLFGTMPLFLIPFIFLGLAAGVLTLMRSAREVQTKREAADEAAQTEDQGG